MAQKTNKLAAKRLKVTKNRKVMHRGINQNHFNATDTGNQTRNKRGDRRVPRAQEKEILKQMLPKT